MTGGFIDPDAPLRRALERIRALEERVAKLEAALSSDPQPLGSAREATEDGQHKTNPDPAVRHGRDSQGGER